MRIRRRARKSRETSTPNGSGAPDLASDPEQASPPVDEPQPSLRSRASSNVRSFSEAVARRTAAPPQRHGQDLRTTLSADVQALIGPLRAVWHAVGALLAEPDPPPRPPSRRRLAGLVRRAPVLLAIAAGGTFLVTMPVVGDSFRTPGFLVPVLAAMIAFPLWLAAATPLRAWRLLVLVGLFVPMVTQPSTENGLPWPLPMVLVAIAVYYALALRHHWRVVLAVWMSTIVLVMLGALIAGMSLIGDVTAAAATILGVVLLVGYLVGARGEMERRLDEGERQREESETQRVLLEERARIARELHDVVAHHMSMISVQAETAPFRIPDLNDAAKASLASIAETSREALADMRRLLGLLRDGQRGADKAPQPDLEQLDQLVAGARRAGLAVELRVTGTARPLLPGTELSAYRIVQEGLSNVASHAPDAAVHVDLHYAPSSLTVRVVNEASPTPTTAPSSGRGHGLLGMRERAALHGGTLDAGPTPDGGYRVEAWLPLTDDDPATTALAPETPTS